MKKLSKQEMKNVQGGGYRCSCVGSAGTWQYTSGNRPSDAVVAQDVSDNCSSGSASCGYFNEQ